MKAVLIFIVLALGVSVSLSAEPWELEWKCSKIYQPQMTAEEMLSNLKAVIIAHAKEKSFCLLNTESGSGFDLYCDGKKLDATFDLLCPKFYYGKQPTETWVGMVLIAQDFSLNAVTSTINGSYQSYFTKPK